MIAFFKVLLYKKVVHRRFNALNFCKSNIMSHGILDFVIANCYLIFPNKITNIWVILINSCMCNILLNLSCSLDINKR